MATFGRTSNRPAHNDQTSVPVDRNDVHPDDLDMPKPVAEAKPQDGEPEVKPQVTPETETDKAKRKYVKADLSKITLEMATAVPLAEVELNTLPVEDAEPRSDVQKQIDAQFADAYTAWEAAGKPKTVRECYEHDRAVHAEFKAKQEEAPHTQLIVRRFLLDPEQEAAFRVLVRKAAEVGGHSAKILPIASHVSGRHVLIWMPRDLVKRAPKKTEATPADLRAAKNATATSVVDSAKKFSEAK